MKPEARILVTGGSGMLGSALMRALANAGYTSTFSPARSEMDLTREESVRAMFKEYQPEHVFMVGAKVGGIAANIADPVGFLETNLLMQSSVFRACAAFPPLRSVFVGSSCIYPRGSPQPMREEYLLTGPLEPTNEGYALAKIVGLKLAEAYERQHRIHIITPMFCNLYGTGDHFDFAQSHVLSALVRRFVDATDTAAPTVTVWGTGSARREFLHVDDAADSLIFLINHRETSEPINVGMGTDVSIRELANLIARTVDYAGKIEWDLSKPDGMPVKRLDVSRMRAMGFVPKVSLQQGIEKTVSEYRTRKAQGLVR